MKKITSLLLSTFVCVISIAQQDSIQARIVLIGDAGQLTKGKQPVISSVRKNIKLDKKTAVLYLGDNLYTYGLPDIQHPSFKDARAILDSQVSIAEGTQAQVYIIPGNHDWGRNGPNGYEAVLRQQYYIELLSNKYVHFFPGDGCPGPIEVEVSSEVVMILIDSQWWIHPYDKPGIESDCPYKSKTEVLNQLEDLLVKNSRKLVILATHHPFKSYGIHGGFFTLKQHLFPLTDIRPNLYVPVPILGTIYPIARGVFGTPQDLKHPLYANMITQIQKVVKSHPNVIFVAGHEHTQQLIKDSSYYYIVSGAGSKKTRVSKGKNLKHRSDSTGYAVLEISKNKNVNVRFYNVQGEVTNKAFDQNLFNFSRPPEKVFEDTIPIVAVQVSNDSVVVKANENYAKAKNVKRFLNGENYRAEWATPVKLPVFTLKKRGYTIQSIGGGKQTRSLRLKDKSGREWVLRTIDKELDKLLPEGFQGTFAQDYLHDFVSTAHPYSPVIVPGLAKAAKVLVANPTIYFVPNENDFGVYKSLFANKVCLLEEYEPIQKDQNTRSTAKVLNRMEEDNEHHVDQEAVLRARLLDFLIADWDRHFDQWRFLVNDTGKGKLYYPIPRDRDQAFSFSDGVLLSLITKNKMPFLRGFRNETPDIKWLAYWARDFDRLFMNNLEKEDWEKAIKQFQANMTDNVIHTAVSKLPPEIYAIKGQLFEQKLKHRRDVMLRDVMKYYNFLSKYVNIVGSNKQEYFKVSKVGKQVQVRVYKKKEMDTLSIMYDRKFDDDVTKEIRLYGLNENDYFDIDANATSDIKIRIIGGRGNDTFNVKGDVKAFVYDFQTEENSVIKGDKVQRRFTSDPVIQEYSPVGFQYDRYTFPNLNLGYNPEDGVLVGVGFTRKTYRFQKQPFATRQKLSSLFAINRGSYQLQYNGQFNRAIGTTDILVNAQLVNPVLNNFYGLGNNSENNVNLDKTYYRVRYNYAQAEVLLGKRPNDVLTYGAGPQFYYYWNNLSDNKNRILSRPSDIGLDSAEVYSTKSYAGLKVMAIVNNLNSELNPTRGVYWLTQFSALGGLNKSSRSLVAFTTDMTLYSSLTEPAKFMSVLRIGGGHIFSKDFEYFQALNLGQNNFLRGFRKNRFAGSGIFYGSLELRHKLFQSRSYVFPGAVGIIAFNDVGRVWLRGEESNRWHDSYGGGLYYAAYNTVLISTTIAFSEEEKLFNFTLGAKFNLTF
jgi:hypothetical protein